MAKENKPTHEIRIDNIRATIWTNVSSTGEAWFSVTTKGESIEKRREA